MPAEQPMIEAVPFCQTHRYLLVRQCGFSRSDPWMALEIVANIVIFQGASCDPKVHAEIGGDITKMKKLGCLACRKPDLFGEIVEAGKSKDLNDVKALGEKWIAAAAATKGDQT